MKTPPKCKCGKPALPSTQGRYMKYCSDECRKKAKSKVNTRPITKEQIKEHLARIEKVLEPSSYEVVSNEGWHVMLECRKCGTQKSTTFGSVSSKTCPCSKGAKIAKTQAFSKKEFVSKYLKGRKLKLLSKYTRMNDKCTFLCTVCNHEFRALASNVALRNSGCPRMRCSNHASRVRCLAKHGCEFHAQRQEVRAAFTATMQRRYGVDHPSQSKTLSDRNRSYRRKSYMLGDKLVLVQGYEPQALDYMLQHHNVVPSDIVCGVGSDVPSIKYVGSDNKTHVYIPDIFIPKFNRIIEVKSKYTAKISKQSIRRKAKACVDSGYKFTLLIMDGKGNRL